MKVIKDGQIVLDIIAAPEAPVDEPVVFPNRAELEQFIADYITSFLAEGPVEGEN